MSKFGQITTDDPETGFGGGGAGEGACWRYKKINLNLALSGITSKGLVGHGFPPDIWVAATGKRLSSGECGPYSTPPWKCKPDPPGTGKEVPLERGKEKLKVELSFGSKKLNKTTCYKCKDSTDPVAMVVDFIGEDGLELLRDFMDAICDGKDSVIEINIEALCNLGIKGSCASPTDRKKCKKKSSFTFGSRGIFQLPNSFSLINGEKINGIMLCFLWRGLRQCLFEDGGSGSAKPGIAIKLAECLEDIFSATNIAATTAEVGTDIDALMVDLARQLAECLDCVMEV